jgi:hypothetical protein
MIAPVCHIAQHLGQIGPKLAHRDDLRHAR